METKQDFDPLEVVIFVSGPRKGETVQDALTHVANALANEFMKIGDEANVYLEEGLYGRAVDMFFDRFRACLYPDTDVVPGMTYRLVVPFAPSILP